MLWLIVSIKQVRLTQFWLRKSSITIRSIPVGFNQASSTYSILTAFGEPGVARLPRAVLQNLKNRKNFYKISVHILYNQILKITKNHQNILVKSIGYKDNFSIMLKLQNLPRFLDFLRFCSFNIIFPFFLQIFCLWK